MLIECVNCGFYVSDQDAFCPDCGLFDPDVSVESVSDAVEGKFLTKVIVIVGAAVIIGGVVYRLNEHRADFSDFFATAMEILSILTIFSIIIALLLTRHSAGEVRRHRFVSSETPLTFQFIQETILLRNYELEDCLKDLRLSVKRGAVPSGDERLGLATRKNAVLDLKAFYDLLSEKINFARLKNELPMLTNYLNGLEKDAESAERLNELLAELISLRWSLTDDYSTELSESFQIEKQKILREIAETILFAETWLDRSDPLLFQNGFDARVMLKDYADAFSEAERRFQKLR